jgi:uncharacterized protein
MMWRIVAIGAMWSSMWWLIIGAVIAPVIPGGWLTIAAAAVLAIAPLLLLVQRFRGAYPGTFIRLFVFRPFWYVQLAAPLMALGALAGVIAGLPFGAPLLTGRLAVASVAAVFVGAALVGFIGSKLLRVKRLELDFPDLPDAFDGVRVVQVSDVHVGPHTPRQFLSRIVRAVQQAKPDLIVYTGDHVDDFAGDVAHFAGAFGELSAPLGVFAVAGNHDIYAGWADVRRGLETMGVTVLVNEAIAIRRGSDAIWVAGTGDPAGNGGPLGRTAEVAPNIPQTLARVPGDAFTIALAHNPALWPQLAERGVRLTLSGHTHYGQLSIPHMQWSLASLFLEHAMGTHTRRQSVLYISPGTNYWGLPLRIGALAEVTVVTLRRRRLTPEATAGARSAPRAGEFPSMP